jgi:hypothetical protein
MLYEKHILEFIILTLILGGWLAFMTGRAFALTWRNVAMLLFALLFIGLVNRFIHFAVVKGALFSLKYYMSDTFCLIIIGLIGFHFTRKKQMLTQYWWLYEPVGFLGYRLRKTPLAHKNNA